MAPYPVDDGFGEELFLPSSNSCRMRSFSRTAMTWIFLSFRIWLVADNPPVNDFCASHQTKARTANARERERILILGDPG